VRCTGTPTAIRYPWSSCWTGSPANTSHNGLFDLRVEIAAADSPADELADVAAQTFPLACPPSVPAQNVASFIASNLSADRFAEYLTDPHRAIITAQLDGRIAGYAMLVRESAQHDISVELSKMYIVNDFHGHGLAAELMDAVLAVATEWGATRVWLGVNQQNLRAQRFYSKRGFAINGTRTFRLGDHVEDDYLMVRQTGLS
jgi:ribosomal protein S18 acetylase RimI-like enzyme